METPHIQSTKETAGSFVAPRSALGRAMLFLFTFPLINWAYYWLYGFTIPWRKSFDEFSKTFPNERNILDFEKLGAEYFSTKILMLIKNFILVYMDRLISWAAIALVVYVAAIFLRGTNEGQARARRVFKICVVATVFYYLIPLMTLAYYYCFPPVNFNYAKPSILQDFFNYFTLILLLSAAIYYLYFLFKKTPFGDDVSWSAEMSRKEFVGGNLAAIKSRLGRNARAKLILAILVFIVLDFLKFVGIQ